ncbi:hypothetical protein FHX73_113686 [Kitasatospora viridis]|uniref:Uncharacterized protein n=1 Tax=Kitasatospora viridis TaxID=281105 RepID=A0A561UKE3_9ACTN|nr:hypothetical protein FHX73_113686 [Kitasatospora viridis]
MRVRRVEVPQALRESSGLVAAYNVVVVREASVLGATAVRFKSPVGRVVWRTAQPIHQIAVPKLLKRASRSLSAG